MEKKLSWVETVKTYQKFKESQGDTSRVTHAELKSLRENFNAGKITSEEAPESGYKKLLKEFSEWKFKKTGEERVTLSEKRQLKESLTKQAEETETDEFKKLLKEYSEYKFKETGDNLVTLAERKKIKESLEAKSKDDNSSEFEKALKEYSEYKFAKTGDKTVTLAERASLRKGLANIKETEMESIKDKLSNLAETEEPTEEKQVDEKTLNESLHNVRKIVFAGKKALKEGDMMGAEAAVMDGAEAMDGVADATAGVQCSPDIIQKIQAVQTSVNDLATAVGIEPPVDMGADAAAGVPADTSVGMDPNAAAPMPMAESYDLEAARARIAEREAKLAEHVGAEQIAKAINADLPNVGNMKKGTQLSGGRRISHTNAPSQKAGEATTQQAIAGSKTAAKTWPTRPLKGVAQPGKKLGNVKESTERTLDDQMVDNILNEEKLNFKEIFKSGSILG